MDMTIPIILLVILILLPLVKRIFKDDVQDFSVNEELNNIQKPANPDPLKNENQKPSFDSLQFILSDMNYGLLKFLISELQNIGDHDFLWRGESRGWVLSVKDSFGRYGVVQLLNDQLYGIMSLPRFRLKVIISDKNLPKRFKPKNFPEPFSAESSDTLFGYMPIIIEIKDVDLNLIERDYELGIQLVDEDVCSDFIELMVLNLQYFEYDR